MKMLIPIMLLSSVAAAGTGTERAWTCLGGGVIDDPACWQDGLVPGPLDTAVFDLGGGYSIDVEGAPTPFENDRLVLRRGFVTIDHSAGGRYYLGTPGFTGPTIVGESGLANCVLTTILGVQGTVQAHVGGMSIGHEPGALGVVDYVAAEDLLFTAVNVGLELTVGAEGTGFLCIDGGDVPTFLTGTASYVIGDASGSAGTMMLTGNVDANGGVSNAPLVVGRAGFGQLLVEHGARVSGQGGFIIGEQVGSFGVLTVNGTDSSADSSVGGAVIGGLGQASVEVLDGGCLSIHGGGMILGRDMNATQQGHGVLRVEGFGSEASCHGSLFLGMGGSGTLVLSRGGIFEAGGDVVRGPFADNRIFVELGAADDYPVAALQCDGLTDTLAMDVVLRDDFVPSAGDTFRLVEVGLSLGPIVIDPPPLPEPLEWIFLVDAVSTTLRVGPVPGDVNGDGVVDVDDLVIVITEWGACRVPPGGCDGDLNGDGVVNVNDLVLVVENWG